MCFLTRSFGSPQRSQRWSTWVTRQVLSLLQSYLRLGQSLGYRALLDWWPCYWWPQASPARWVGCCLEQAVWTCRQPGPCRQHWWCEHGRRVQNQRPALAVPLPLQGLRHYQPYFKYAQAQMQIAAYGKAFSDSTKIPIEAGIIINTTRDEGQLFVADKPDLKKSLTKFH